MFLQLNLDGHFSEIVSDIKRYIIGTFTSLFLNCMRQIRNMFRICSETDKETL